MNNISKFDLLPKKVLTPAPERILYISSIGTSGYATAAKGYLYELNAKKAYVHWIQYDQANTSYIEESTTFDKFIAKSKKTIFSTYSTVIIHSVPLVWNELFFNANINSDKNIKIIGRTVWEFENVHPDWIKSINESVVTTVSVPTEWNKQIFIKNGVTKPIIVEPHVFTNVGDTRFTIEHLLKKSVIIYKKDLVGINLNDYYKFYCIEQLTHRKNIDDTIETFCRSFKSTDRVILFVKTFRANYSIEEQIECAKYINELTLKYDHAPIVFIKDQLNYDEIQSLHYNCDCYLTLTHTEGFGLSIHDAYNHKNKIIATGYGGHVEYLGIDYEGLIKYNLTEVNSYIFRNYYLDNKYKWATPDKDHAVELCKNNYIQGLKSEKYVVSNFTKDKICISITDQHPDVKILDFPYDVNNFYFNPSLFKLNNQNYIMTRYCHVDDDLIPHNTLKLFNLDKNLKSVELNIVDEIEDEQYEDPRVLVAEDKIYISCANYQLHNSSYIHQKVLVFDKEFNHIDNIHPVYDGNAKDCLTNTKSQKNWTYFIENGKLMCVYKMYPHTVLEFDNKGNIVSEYISHVNINKIWKFGECRMGSNPILKDGYYHNFFHSSIPWKNPKRQYLMGYYKFESKPPYKIVEISNEPILWGNETDFRFLPKNSPLVVFPCGAIVEDNNFYVSFGFNDEKTGIIKI